MATSRVVRTYSLITSIINTLLKKRENFKIMEFKQSKNKPFIIVKNKEGKFIICVGSAQVCEKKFDTVEQAEKFIGTKPYELIFNTMFYILDLKKNEKETKKTAESGEKN